MLSSRSKPKPNRSDAILNFEAIGTEWSIELKAETDILDGIIKRVTSRIARFDADYSRFRQDSLIMRMSRQAGMYTLPDDAEPMIALYHDLYRLTDGAMTPLVGQVLSDAGYDAEYSLRSKRLTRPPSWEESIEYDAPRLTLKQPALLDFGAIGKGYLVDIVGDILHEEGIDTFLINAGGDILHRDVTGTAEVGLEHPDNTDMAIGVARLHNESLCGSAGNRRKWKDYHHIINPKSLKSPHHILAVWVIADTAMLADALTTALFFAEPERLQEHYSFRYAIVYKDHALRASKDFPATFFTDDKDLQ